MFKETKMTDEIEEITKDPCYTCRKEDDPKITLKEALAWWEAHISK